jgi:hypothetical protein
VCSRHLSMSLALLVMVVPPAFAQLNFQHQPAKDPYRNLFATPQTDRDTPRDESTRAATNAPPQRKKTILMCGTLVVPSDPSVDPKIRVGPREDGVAQTMRVLPPPACADGR